jgi:hypothetical protein
VTELTISESQSGVVYSVVEGSREPEVVALCVSEGEQVIDRARDEVRVAAGRRVAQSRRGARIEQKRWRPSAIAGRHGATSSARMTTLTERGG